MPIGNQGEKGDPSILAFSFINIFLPTTYGGNTYVELARFPFSNTIAKPFTGFKMNMWTTAGVGSFRIIDLVTSNVIYENTNVTSNSDINIETIEGIDAYDAGNSLLAIQYKHNVGAGDSVCAASATFYYK